MQAKERWLQETVGGGDPDSRTDLTVGEGLRARRAPGQQRACHWWQLWRCQVGAAEAGWGCIVKAKEFLLISS